MRIYKGKDYEEMSQIAARILSAQLIMKPDCVLGLATGSTPVGAYKILVQNCKEGKIDFSEVTTVNLDEYKGISGDNEQSYRYFMDSNLFNHVNVDKSRTFVPNGLNEDSEDECAKYDAIIKNAGGIDLQLVGLGHNGHIGFNEPSDIFKCGTHCVDLSERTIEANKRFFESADDVPKQAYTMGIQTIMSAKKVVMVVSGKDKAETVKNAFFGPVTPAVPASILQMHPDFVLVADEDALSLV